MQNPGDHYDGRGKRNIEMLRKIFIAKYVKNCPEHPITPKIMSYIEKQLKEALSHTSKSSDHIPYQFMIIAALQNLDKGGSTEDAISEYIETNFTGLPWQHRSFMKNGLEKLCSSGEIVVTDDQLYKLPADNPVVEAEHKMVYTRKGRPQKKSSKRPEETKKDRQRFEGSKRENQGDRRCSKRVEEIQSMGKHVEMISRESAEISGTLDRAEAEQNAQRKETVDIIGKNNEAGKHQINVNSKETMSKTDELLSSRSEAEKPGGCPHCSDPLSAQMMSTRDLAYKKQAYTDEVNNLREQLAKLRRDMQKLASKIDEGSFMLTGCLHGQSVSSIDIIDRSRQDLSQKDKHKDHKAAFHEDEQLQGPPGHPPPELQHNTLSLVVLLNAEAEENAASSQLQLKKENHFELNSQGLAHSPLELKKSKRGRGRPRKLKDVTDNNMEVTLSDQLVQYPEKRPVQLPRRGRPPKQKLNYVMTLPRVMSLDCGYNRDSHRVRMQSDNQFKLTKVESMKRRGRGRPRKRKLDA